MIGGTGIKNIDISRIVKVQTDGSFRKGRAQIAAIVNDENNYLKNIKAVNSTETEWASVLLGLRSALELNYSYIELENDNLGVVRELSILNREPRQLYARYYKSHIIDLAMQSKYTGIRWIPRRQNMADNLFRKEF